MDNLTHSLTGAVLSQAGLNRFTPRATWLMVLALNAPDVDVAWSLGDSYLDYHRGFTHSLLFVPLMGALPMLLLRQFHWRAWLLGVMGVLAHITQDLTNVYGVRLFLPVTSKWFRLDLINIIDPWIWLLLLFAVLWPVLSRLVSGEIGARPTRGAGLARAALACLLLYMGGRFFTHERALAILSSRIYEEGPLRSVAAFPTLLNPLEWNGAVETESAWRLLPVSLLGRFNPAAGELYPKGSPHAAAAATKPFQVLLRFSQFPFWQSVPSPDLEGGHVVELNDLRFGRPGAGNGFTARAIIDATGRVLNTGYRFGFQQRLPEGP